MDMVIEMEVKCIVRVFQWVIRAAKGGRLVVVVAGMGIANS